MGQPSQATDGTIRQPTRDQYRSRTRRRRHRRRGQRTKTENRLQLAYFSLASLWGFVAGTAAILALLAVIGRPLGLSTAASTAIGGAALISVFGGFLASRGYRDAVNRRAD